GDDRFAAFDIVPKRRGRGRWKWSVRTTVMCGSECSRGGDHIQMIGAAQMATAWHSRSTCHHNRVIARSPILRCDFPPAASTTLPRAKFRARFGKVKNPENGTFSRASCLVAGKI